MNFALLLNVPLFLLHVLISILLIWISFFLLVFVHEMGHALMYRIFYHDNDWHIKIGTTGRTIIKLKKFTVRVFPIPGLFTHTPKYQESKLQYIMMCLGGPLATAFFIIILIFSLQIIKANELTFEQFNLLEFLEHTLKLNVYAFVFSAVPMKLSFWPLKGYISDGMHIFMKAKEASKR